MFDGFFLRAISRAQRLVRAMALRNPGTLRGSEGFGGLLRLLETLEGAEAIELLRSGGAEVGAGTLILRGLVVHNADSGFANLRIGSRCHIGRQGFIDLAGPVSIGERATISMRCILLTHTNVGDSRCGLASSTEGLQIEDDVYIGAGAIVLPGLRIGARSIVGAGAVVTRNVAADSVVAGVPAKPILDKDCLMVETKSPVS